MDVSSSLTSFRKLQFSALFWLGQLAALVSIVAGLVSIFVQTPQTKSTLHWNSAFMTYTAARTLPPEKKAQAYDEARALALKALSYDAHDPDLWFRYANLETRMAGVLTPSAEQALDIAADLNPEMATKIELYRDQLKLLERQKERRQP